MAVTGVADPDRLLRNDAGRPGLPLTLTKPLGVGVLNNRHKATGRGLPAGGRDDDGAQREAAAAALAAGVVCATDVTGFGLLGHLHKLARASGVTARGRRRGRARTSTAPGRRCAAGYVSGGTRRNLDWVRPHLDRPPWRTRTSCCCSPTPRPPAACSSSARCPAHPVIGELVPRGQHTIVVR